MLFYVIFTFYLCQEVGSGCGEEFKLDFDKNPPSLYEISNGFFDEANALWLQANTDPASVADAQFAALTQKFDELTQLHLAEVGRGQIGYYTAYTRIFKAQKRLLQVCGHHAAAEYIESWFQNAMRFFKNTHLEVDARIAACIELVQKNEYGKARELIEGIYDHPLYQDPEKIPENELWHYLDGLLRVPALRIHTGDNQGAVEAYRRIFAFAKNTHYCDHELWVAMGKFDSFSRYHYPAARATYDAVLLEHGTGCLRGFVPEDLERELADQQMIPERLQESQAERAAWRGRGGISEQALQFEFNCMKIRWFMKNMAEIREAFGTRQ